MRHPFPGNWQCCLKEQKFFRHLALARGSGKGPSGTSSPCSRLMAFKYENLAWTVDETVPHPAWIAKTHRSPPHVLLQGDRTPGTSCLRCAPPAWDSGRVNMAVQPLASRWHGTTSRPVVPGDFAHSGARPHRSNDAGASAPSSGEIFGLTACWDRCPGSCAKSSWSFPRSSASRGVARPRLACGTVSSNRVILSFLDADRCATEQGAQHICKS